MGKRVVFVTGDKGGVGKSFSSRLLIEWYEERGVKVSAFDTDKANSTLYRFFEKSEIQGLSLNQLDIDDPIALDEFLEKIAEAKDNEVFLVDCAARTLDRLVTWIREVDFLNLAQELDLKVTLAFVLGTEKDCVAILRDTLESFGEAVEYVVIKNQARGNDFRVYEGSKARERLIESLGGTEISLPGLFVKTSIEVDRLSMPFSRAIGENALGIADRSRLKTWRGNAFSVLSEAESRWV